MNKIIDKYIISRYLKTLINVTLIFICIGIILNLFEEIEFFKDLNVSLKLPLLLTAMFIPNLIIMKLLPFIVFIASIWYTLSLRNNTDLLNLKVFGYSNLKIIIIISTSAFIFGLIVLFIINPITSAMIKYYESTKAQYSKDIDHLVSINKNGVWIKESQDDNLKIITGKKIDNEYIYDISIYLINKENKILERIEAEKADISTNIWNLQNVSIYKFSGDNKLIFKENYQIKSNYNSAKLSTLYKNLDTISFIQLITEYDQLLKRGYSKRILNEKLNIFISLPVFLFLMVVLASIFTMCSVKRSQNLYYIFISIISCVLIYYFKDLSIALGQTNRISLTLSVWMPIIAVSLFCSIGIIQINEK